jgi:hypothetical protein
MEATWGNTAYDNPPYGALLTYSIGQAPSGDQKLAVDIVDNDGKQVRRLELCGDETAPGLHRIAWDLRAATPNAPSRCSPTQGRGGFGGFGGRGGAASAVAQGRYVATIGTLNGDNFTAIGKPVSFLVLPLPR